MVEVVRHNCGLSVAHTLHDAHSFIQSLQHRGREAAGIAAVGDGRIDIIKWKGGVSTFDVTDLYKISPWWLELPDVEDVMNQQRRKILVEVIPLGDPSTATLASMHLQQEGRAIYHRYTIALYRGGQDFFGVVVGYVCVRARAFVLSCAECV